MPLRVGALNGNPIYWIGKKKGQLQNDKSQIENQAISRRSKALSNHKTQAPMRSKLDREFKVLDSQKLLQEIEELESKVIQLGYEWAEAYRRDQINKADLGAELIRVEYQLVKKHLETLYSLHYLLTLGIQAI